MRNGFASGLAMGAQTARQILDAYNLQQDREKQAGMESEIKAAMEAKPTQSDGFTAQDGQQLEALAAAKDPNGQPYYNLTANPDGTYGVASNFQAAGADGQQVTPAPVQVAPQRVSDFLGQRVPGQITPEQEQAMRNKAVVGALTKRDVLAGFNMQRGLNQDDRENQRFAWEKAKGESEVRRIQQAESDSDELRGAMSGKPSDALASWSNAGQPGNAPGQAPGSAQGETSGEAPGKADLQSYLANVAPGIVGTLLKQGRVEDAKRYQDFVDSAHGKQYANAWVTGLRKHAMGDHVGAVNAFQKLYNDQLFNDGQTAKMTPIDGGKLYKVDLFDAQGQAVGSQTMDPAKLANQAALMLDPVRAVEFHAQQQGKRDAEAANLDRQLQVEKERQKGIEIREDHRDSRLEARLSARGPAQAKPLTAAQQRSNLEIDAAREQVTGMDPMEIRRRTAKTTDTGRENPDFDPGLARAANLAGRRKVGDDQDFDTKPRGQAQPQQAPAINKVDAAKRFRADPAMSAYRLGKETPGGVEVLDASGKVLGHYR